MDLSLKRLTEAPLLDLVPRPFAWNRSINPAFCGEFRIFGRLFRRMPTSNVRLLRPGACTAILELHLNSSNSPGYICLLTINMKFSIVNERGAELYSRKSPHVKRINDFAYNGPMDRLDQSLFLP